MNGGSYGLLTRTILFHIERRFFQVVRQSFRLDFLVVTGFHKNFKMASINRSFKNPLFFFPFVSGVFIWYCFQRASSSQFATHFYIYEIIILNSYLVSYVIIIIIIILVSQAQRKIEVPLLAKIYLRMFKPSVARSVMF